MSSMTVVLPADILFAIGRFLDPVSLSAYRTCNQFLSATDKLDIKVLFVLDAAMLSRKIVKEERKNRNLKQLLSSYERVINHRIGSYFCSPEIQIAQDTLLIRSVIDLRTKKLERSKINESQNLAILKFSKSV